MILIIGADYMSLLNLGATYTAKSFSESKYMKHMEKLIFLLQGPSTSEVDKHHF